MGGATLVLAAGGGTSFSVGDFLVIGFADVVHVGKVSAKVTDTLTLATGYTMPTTAVFPVGTQVYPIGSSTNGVVFAGTVPAVNTFGVKIVGILPATGAPVTLIFPKVRITKGLSINFQTNDFTNMPFEFDPWALLATDPYYSDFTGLRSWAIFRT